MSHRSVKEGYPVMEHFYTLQGEGAFVGHAAYFIRLGGCNIGCVWCDVKESWPMENHPVMMVSEIVEAAQAHASRLAVITGGEPTMHNLSPLTQALRHGGFRTHIETSGAYTLSGDLDWITLSPKKFKAPLEENLQRADEFKVVIYHPSDLEWAQSFRDKLHADCRLYLQPEWSKMEQAMSWILPFIHQHPEWQLSLQTHKFIDIP